MVQAIQANITPNLSHRYQFQQAPVVQRAEIASHVFRPDRLQSPSIRYPEVKPYPIVPNFQSPTSVFPRPDFQYPTPVFPKPNLQYPNPVFPRPGFNPVPASPTTPPPSSKSGISPGLKVAGILAASTAAGGGIGYAISRGMGYAGVGGIVIGAIAGLVIPIALNEIL